MENESFETAKAIYDQDCEFVRYHDLKMWGRFKTIAAIEGATLYGLYVLTTFHAWERQMTALVGLIFVLLCSVLTLTDRSTALEHLKRMQSFETGNPFRPVKPKWLKAEPYLLASGVLLNATNLMLAVSIWVRN